MRGMVVTVMLTGVFTWSFSREIFLDYAPLVNRAVLARPHGFVGDLVPKARSAYSGFRKYDSILHSYSDLRFFKTNTGWTLEGTAAAQQHVKSNKTFMKAWEEYPSAVAEVNMYKALLEPYLLQYSYLVEDLFAASDTVRPRHQLIDIASLYPEGSAQPAWVDLLRSRRFVVFSDGAGYVRAFLPGSDARQAYDDNYYAIRQVLNALLDGLHTAGRKTMTLDVYAFENNFAAQFITLHFPRYSVTVNKRLDIADKRPALDVRALSAFLAQGLTLEGGRIDSVNGLTLIGSKQPKGMTFLGEMAGIADLAVAYRAFFYSGSDSVYQSLDPSLLPEFASANFGGRLYDTRIGGVALKTDIRFKTICTGLDCYSENDDAAMLQAKLGFVSIIDRKLLDAQSKKVAFENTRLWLYPDTTRMKVRIGSDWTSMLIVNPRYSADAERQDIKAQRKNYAWTRASIDHLNAQYERYAAIYPEFGELDNVGRIFLLFRWLLEAKKQGAVLPDLDQLLSVELPAYRTPRHKLQMLAANVKIEPENSKADIRCRFGYSWIARERLATTGTDVNDISSIRRALASTVTRFLADSGISPANRQVLVAIAGRMDAMSPAEITAQYRMFDSIALWNDLNIWSSAGAKDTLEKIQQATRKDCMVTRDVSVGGGISMGPSFPIQFHLAMDENSLKLMSGVMAAQPADGSKPPNSAFQWYRSGLNKIAAVAETTPVPDHRISPVEPGKQKNAPGLRLFSAGNVGIALVSEKKDNGSRLLHRGPADPFSPAPSRTFRQTQANTRVFRHEADKVMAYRIFRQENQPSAAKSGATLESDEQTVYRSRLLSAPLDDAAERSRALCGRMLEAARPAEAMRNTPDGLGLRCFAEPSPSSMALLGSDGTQSRLFTAQRKADGTVENKVFKGEPAVQEYRNMISSAIAQNSDERITFFHPFQNGRVVTIFLGKQKVALPLAQYFTLLADPETASAPELDKTVESADLFALYCDQQARAGRILSGQTQSSPDYSALVNALSVRYGQKGKRFMLCHDFDRARENILAAAAIPDQSKITVLDLRYAGATCCGDANDLGSAGYVSFGAQRARILKPGERNPGRTDLLVAVVDNGSDWESDLGNLVSSGTLKGKQLVICGNIIQWNIDRIGEWMARGGVKAIMLKGCLPLTGETISQFLDGLTRSGQADGRRLIDAVHDGSAILSAQRSRGFRNFQASPGYRAILLMS